MWKTIKKIGIFIGLLVGFFALYYYIYVNPIMQKKDAEISLLGSQRDDCREKLNIERQASDNFSM